MGLLFGGPGGEPKGSPVPRGCPVDQPVWAAAPVGTVMAVSSTAITGATMTSSSGGDDLSLTISIYGCIEWCGPRAKLEASGLIPANFKWPKRIDYGHWHADGFNFSLRRCRPDGLMGPMRSWMKYDYWVMSRSMPRHPDDIWQIHEPVS